MGTIRNFKATPLGELPNCHDGVGVLDFTELFNEDDFKTRLRFFHHTVLPPHTSIGIHQHGDDEEIYVVLSGKGIMHLDGVDYPVEPGSVIVNSPFGVHGVRNEGPEHLEMLVFEVGND